MKYEMFIKLNALLVKEGNTQRISRPLALLVTAILDRHWRFGEQTSLPNRKGWEDPFYCIGMYGQLKLDPERSMSRIRVSIGVLPTRRTKKSCSMTGAETIRKDGRRSRRRPKRVGWLGYWFRTYSSRAHWDFSWMLSTWPISDSPTASARQQVRDIKNKTLFYYI